MYKSIHLIAAGAALFALSGWTWAADPPAKGAPYQHPMAPIN